MKKSRLSKWSLCAFVLSFMVLVSCSKDKNVQEDVPSQVSNEKVEFKSVQQVSIEDAEQRGDSFRLDLISRVPIFEDVWQMQGFTFDESSLPSLVSINSSVSADGDVITVEGVDAENNKYKMRLSKVMPPTGPGSDTIQNLRWPTGNEWVCLGLSLSASVLSGGLGTYATVANFVAIMLVEEAMAVQIEGWYNNQKEFTFLEEVYESEDGTHMNGVLQIDAAGKDVIFEANGLITGNNNNSIIFKRPVASPQIEWTNIGNPGDLTEIPPHIYQLDSLYGSNVPYTIHSNRKALLGELVRLSIQL